jgi:type IV secretory pathway VirB9-like protein
VIVLAPGEKMVGSPICGDLVRWKINMINAAGEQHLTIQPLKINITTSITIATNQGRLYLLEATSLKNNYMAVVRWNY